MPGYLIVSVRLRLFSCRRKYTSFGKFLASNKFRAWWKSSERYVHIKFHEECGPKTDLATF